MPGGIRPPLEVILSWPARSEHPERHGWGLTITTIILFCITLAVVVARLWARMVLQRNAGLDDVFIVGSMVRLICFHWLLPFLRL
jgi:hypothetical protein